MLFQGLKNSWQAVRKWISGKWISSLYFDFLAWDFILSILHYGWVGKFAPKDTTFSGYIKENLSIEWWVLDFTWFIRIASLCFFPIILGYIGYKATKKELAGAIIYGTLALKDCRDYYVNWNQGTSLVDYSVLFVCLTLMQLHFHYNVKDKT